MNLDELLMKLKEEYLECITKLNEANALLEELQKIKQQGNYEKEITDLVFKQTILANPRKSKISCFINSANTCLLIFLLVVLLALGIKSYVVATIFSLPMLLTAYNFIKSSLNEYQKIKQILTKENLEDITQELNDKKEEQIAIDEDIKYYQSMVNDLENEIAMHFNTYQNIAQVDKLENPLMPVQAVFEEEKGRERVLKHE